MTVVCPIARCRAENEPTAGSCRRCGTPLQAYVRLSAHAARLFNEGLAAARSGDHATARDRFAAIVHWYPDDMEAHNALALACYHLGAPTEAHHHWHLALTRNPNDPVAHQGIAHLTSASGPADEPRQPAPAAPVPAQSQPAAPMSAQPAPSRSASAEPPTAESVPVEPASAELNPAQPTPAQPVSAEPVSAEPDPAQPTPAEPAPVQPAPAEPAPAPDPVSPVDSAVPE